MKNLAALFVIVCAFAFVAGCANEEAGVVEPATASDPAAHAAYEEQMGAHSDPAAQPTTEEPAAEEPVAEEPALETPAEEPADADPTE